MKRWPLRKTWFWETAPFFRLLLPFAAGIFCYGRFSSPAILTFIAIALLAFLFFTVVSVKRKPAALTITFLLAQLFFFLSGLAITFIGDDKNKSDWFGTNIRHDATYVVKVNGTPAPREHSWKLPVTIVGVVENGKAKSANGEALVYLYKDQMPMLYNYGDTLLLPGDWEPMSNAGNPFEFDYAGYCRRNNIYYQQFCTSKAVRLYAAVYPGREPITVRVHNWCMNRLEEHLADTTTRGLIQAMLLGDEINLDEQLRQSFSETGIVHVIAISGGNVMIFFSFIGFLMRWLKNKKYLWVQYLLALPLIWFYVLVAGASPSAIRAAIMFSVLAFGILFQKNRNSLNQLLATAFVLLCAQPMWLFSVGFQLSFVAVLSLILFYTPIYKIRIPTSKWLRSLWSVICASIAAEILVAPLVIYYFHNFPLLFVVANVLAFLFMEAVLLLGILIIATSFLPLIAHWLGVATVCFVSFFNAIIAALQHLNPSPLRFLYLSGLELIAFYMVIVGIGAFVLQKRKQGLFIGLCCSCLLLVLLCRDSWASIRQERLVVYNSSGALHIERIAGDHFTVLSTETSAGKKIDYAVTPAHVRWQVWRNNSARHGDIAVVAGKKILILNEGRASASPFPVDYLIVNCADHPDPEMLLKTYSPKLVVIGNSRKKVRRYDTFYS